MKPDLHGTTPLQRALSPAQQRAWNAAIEQLLVRLSQHDWQTGHITYRHVLDAAERTKIQLKTVPANACSRQVGQYTVRWWYEEDTETWSGQCTGPRYAGPVVGHYRTPYSAQASAVGCMVQDVKYGQNRVPVDAEEVEWLR